MKKVYIFLLTLASFYCCQTTNAQQTADPGTGRAQNVYAEVLGQGLLFSVNYDTRFSNKRDGIGGRAGVGYVADGNSSITSVPIGLNYLLGKGKSYFEIGLGATYLTAKLSGDDFFTGNNDSSKGSTVIGTMSFAYRLQPIDSGFSLRAGFAPIFGQGFFIPYYPTFSLGYTFSSRK